MGKAYLQTCIQELRRLERAVLMGDDDESARLEAEYGDLAEVAWVLWEDFAKEGRCGEAQRAGRIYEYITGNLLAGE